MSSTAVPVLVDSPPAPTLMNRAKAVTARIRDLVEVIGNAEAQIAELLLEAERFKLYDQEGYPNVIAYGEAVSGYREAKTRALLRIAERRDELPATWAAFQRGDLPWSKARENVRIATLETEEKWLDRAADLTADKLHDQVNLELGLPVTHRQKLEWAPAQKAIVSAAVDAIRREHGDAVSWSDAIAEICERFLGGEGTDAPQLAARVVYHRCRECDRCTTQGPHGTVDVPAEDVDQAGCNAIETDISAGPSEEKRTVPAKTARFVHDRDRGHCRVFRCTNRGFLHLHHEGGWKNVGHDPDRIYLLCSKHHRMAHRGLIRIEILGQGRLRFFLADGSLFGETDPASTGLRSSRSPSAGTEERTIVRSESKPEDPV